MSLNQQPDPIRQVQPAPDASGTPRLEVKRLLVKCAQTRRLVEASLVREAGEGTRFRVTGFEPAPDKAVIEYSAAQSLFTRIVKFLGEFLNRDQGRPAPDPDQPAKGGDIVYLGMRDIDWAGHNCPACASTKQAPGGGSYTWLQCGNCANMFCVANLEPERWLFTCPWCGNRSRLATTPKGLVSGRPKLLARAEPPRPPAPTRALPGARKAKQLPAPKDP